MKLKLFTVIASTFLLTIPKAYAIEHVISVGAGINYITQDIKVDGTVSGANSTVGTFYQDNYSIKANDKELLPKINLEYQARFDQVYVGVGLSGYVGKFKSTYKSPLDYSDINFETTSTYVDIYPILLFNIFKSNQFAISVGASVALGGINMKSEKEKGLTLDDKALNLGYIQARLIADGELSLNDHVSIFSRVTIAPQALTLVSEKKETRSESAVLPNGSIGLIKAEQTIKPKVSNMGITFGVRYKI